MRYVLGVLLSGLLVTSLLSAPVVDGTKDAQYGSPLAIQTVDTQFGDNSSEWDAGYGIISGGKLYLMLTGNIEGNFNKLEIFVDSKAGGQSVFDSSGNDDAGRMDGLVFDAGFTADYHIIARRGTDNFNDKFDLDFANLVAQSASGYGDFLTGGGNDGVGTTGTGVNSVGISVGYDNSNVAGVGNGIGPADQLAAAAVSTGLELSIDLADLGYTGGPIRVMAGQNNNGHHYWSNQFLGGLPAPQGNLGGDELGNFTGEGAIDMTHFAGNQYFTVNVPEPSTLVLVAIAASALMAHRRKTIPQDRT